MFRLRNMGILPFSELTPSGVIMFGLMRPHLKKSADQRKHIYRRVMRQTKHLKSMSLRETALLILEKRRLM